MVLKGVIHGRTIELESESGLPDGQSVAVELHVDSAGSTQVLTPLERLKRLSGALADEAEEVDEFMRQVRRDRDAWGGRGESE